MYRTFQHCALTAVLKLALIPDDHVREKGARGIRLRARARVQRAANSEEQQQQRECRDKATRAESRLCNIVAVVAAADFAGDSRPTKFDVDISAIPPTTLPGSARPQGTLAGISASGTEGLPNGAAA